MRICPQTTLGAQIAEHHRQGIEGARSHRRERRIGVDVGVAEEEVESVVAATEFLVDTSICEPVETLYRLPQILGGNAECGSELVEGVSAVGETTGEPLLRHRSTRRFTVETVAVDVG